MDKGHEEKEVAQYFVKYMLLPEDLAISYVAARSQPLSGLYLALAYGNGKRLVQRWLQGPDRKAIFRRSFKRSLEEGKTNGEIMEREYLSSWETSETKFLLNLILSLIPFHGK